MENYNTEEEGEESAKKLLDFYVDLVENHNSTIKFYLAENVVLDWFGKTVKENKKVSLFIKDQVCKVTHHMTNTFPTEQVAFRESHHVKVPREENVSEKPPIPPDEDPITPPKQNQPSTSMTEMGQGDGVHNRNVLMSPPKKMKLRAEDDGTETVESETTENHSRLKYITAEGAVEFHRPSIKKLQSETRWKRPVKLHIGYTSSSFKDCTIYLIIYEANLKCRRNLYREFCESESSARDSV